MDDAQEQNQTFTEAHKVKQEPVEYTLDDEDKLTVSQFLLSKLHPLDSSPTVQLERPCAAKKGRALIKKRPCAAKKGLIRTKKTIKKRQCAAKKGQVRIKKMPWGTKYETKQIVSDNPRKNECRERKREIVDNFSDHFVAQSSLVMDRAEEVQASLSPEFPSFIKLMLRSHVTRGFWLGLPSQFCKLHLPRHDETVVLEDESGKENKTNFLADKFGLSGGWRAFSIAKKLLEGDVVVFHLVRPCKFKVYIVRVNDLAVVDGALGLLYFDACGKETDFGAYAEKNSGTCKKAEEKHLRLVPPNILQENPGPLTVQSESDRENLYSSDMESSRLSGSIADFENFNIIVNGLPIDCKLSQHTRTEYYHLCCTQKSYLHDHFLESINSKLAAGIISKTITIADAIRACKLSSTSQDNFAIWDKTLEAFELLGMDVGFLRARLNRLVSLMLESTVAADSKRYDEARVERDRVEEEIGGLELKLLELKQSKSRLDYEIEALNENVQRYEVMFQEVANALW